MESGSDEKEEKLKKYQETGKAEKRAGNNRRKSLKQSSERIFPKSSFCSKKDEEEKKRLSILADAGEELQKYKFEYDKLDSEKRSYDSCLLTEEEIKKEQKQIDGWQEEIIRKETQQKEELEQQRKTRRCWTARSWNFRRQRRKDRRASEKERIRRTDCSG